MTRPTDGPPTGGLRKAMFVIEMHWMKDRTRDETRARHVRELRRQCELFLDRTREYEE